MTTISRNPSDLGPAFEANPEAMLAIDPMADRIVAANPSVAALLGTAPGRVRLTWRGYRPRERAVIALDAADAGLAGSRAYLKVLAPAAAASRASPSSRRAPRSRIRCSAPRTSRSTGPSAARSARNA